MPDHDRRKATTSSSTERSWLRAPLTPETGTFGPTPTLGAVEDEGGFGEVLHAFGASVLDSVSGVVDAAAAGFAWAGDALSYLVDGPPLRFGDQGERVASIQARLREIGWDLAVDGVFGPETLAQVKAFQRHNDLSPDGVVGPDTFAALRGSTPSGRGEDDNPAMTYSWAGAEEGPGARSSDPNGATRTPVQPLGRVDGAYGRYLLEVFGEPRWFVDERNAGEYFRDRLTVTGHEPRGTAGGGGARVLGYGGAWTRAFTEDMPAGDYTAQVENPDGTVDVFQLTYHPARKRESTADQLRGPDGEPTVMYGAFQAQKAMFRMVEVFSPARDLAQAAGGKDMDPYSDRLGADLTATERASSLISGVLKTVTLGSVGAGGAVSAPERVAAITDMVLEGGEASLDVLVDLEVVQGADEAFWRGFLRVLEVGPLLLKGLGHPDELATSDLFATLAMMVEGGEAALRAQYGDEAYERVWAEHADWLGVAFGSAETVAAVIEALAASGK